MSQCTALLDANVPYPAPLRDLLLQLAVTDLYKAKWTADIHREWIDTLQRKEPYRDRVALERTHSLMDGQTRDCLVTGHEPLVHALQLPDPNDRHVLAAAIVGRCDFIVTQNLRDFPKDVLAPLSIEAQHPDEFLSNLLHVARGVFCSCVQKMRRRLRNPPCSAESYLDTLIRMGLAATAAELKPLVHLF